MFKTARISPEISERFDLTEASLLPRLRIALLEGPEARDPLAAWLREAGAQVYSFTRSAELMAQVRRDSFDLFLLDWMVPDASGLAVLNWLKSMKTFSAPAILLIGGSMKTEETGRHEIVQGFAHGADDCIVKPSFKWEVLARVNAVIQRTRDPRGNADILNFSPYTLDLRSQRAMLNGEVFALTPKEFETALFLFNHLNQVVSRNHLLEAVWGMRKAVTTRTVDSHVSKVRVQLKLREHGYALNSIYGFGYRLQQAPCLTEAKLQPPPWQGEHRSLPCQAEC